MIGFSHQFLIAWEINKTNPTGETWDIETHSIPKVLPNSHRMAFYITWGMHDYSPDFLMG